MAGILAELRRRKVFRVAALYVVVAWVLIQVSDVVLPTFGAPPWVNRTIIFLLAVGFLPTLIAAWAYEVTPDGIQAEAASSTAVPSQTTPLHPINYLILGIVLLVAGFQVADRFIGSDDAAGSMAARATASDGGATYPIRTEINLPVNFFGQISDLSPDGRLAALARYGGEKKAGLWLRSLEDLSLTAIPGTGSLGPHSEANFPRFSPDGQSLVFTRGGRIETISLASHASRLLAEADTQTNALWGHDGKIYYAAYDGGIWHVDAGGGVPAEVIPPDSDLPSIATLLDVLPTGRGILYKPTVGTIAVASLETGARKLLVEGGNARVTSTNHLVFSNADGELLAAPLDPQSLEMLAPAIVLEGEPIVEGPASFAVSENGTLVYPRASASGASGFRIELDWVDRTGAATPVEQGWDFPFPESGNASWSLSPDGNQIAYGSRNDIWIKTLPRGPEQRLTFTGGDGSRQVARYPAWSPDGLTVTYTLIDDPEIPNSANHDIWQTRADGTGEPRLWIDYAERGFVQPEWSRDGNWLIMRTGAWAPNTGLRDIVAVRDGEDEVITLVGNSEFAEQSPALSPDGRWLAYTSDASGRLEVYVRPFPDVEGGRWQISANGGIEPVWASGSDELLYVDAEHNLVSARLDTTDSFTVVEREVLFTLGPDYYLAPNTDFMDLSPDDKRVLLGRVVEPRQSLVVVQNFFEVLRSAGLE